MHINFLVGRDNYDEALPVPPPEVITGFNTRLRNRGVSSREHLFGLMNQPVSEQSISEARQARVRGVRTGNKISNNIANMDELTFHHVDVALAKMQVKRFAPDVMNENATGNYNTAHRIIAITTFQTLAIMGTYAKLSINHDWVANTHFLVRVYDNYIHYYLMQRTRAEQKTPGILKSRNKQDTRWKRVKEVGIIPLMLPAT